MEACGGTHTDTTGQVGFIKVMRTERIQDGVERLIFVAGYPAVDYVQKMDSTVEEASAVLGTQRENVIKVISAMKQRLEESEKREKALGDKLVEASIPTLVSSATPMQGPKGKAMLYVSADGEMGDELIVSRGEKLVKAEPSLVNVNISPRGSSTRVDLLRRATRQGRLAWPRTPSSGSYRRP